MVKIKICGVTRMQDIKVINEEKPDFIGFVFAKSKREITPDRAAELRNTLRPEITPIGVFVNEKIELIYSLVRGGVIKMIQLHGAEDNDYIRALKVMTDTPVIKAVPIERRGDAQKWDDSPADYLLLDNKGGGTGICFNWGLIGRVSKLFFLAGGINPQNVKDAVTQTSPFAIDASSGVETDGLKDPDKIRELIRNVRV